MFKLEIDLPIPPSVNTMQRNSRRGRYDTPAYKTFKEEAGWAIRQLSRIPNYTKPVKISYTFYFKTKRLVDIDNFVKPCSDVLTRMNVLQDDNYLYVKEYCIKFGGISKDNPHVQVTVEEI